MGCSQLAAKSALDYARGNVGEIRRELPPTGVLNLGKDVGRAAASEIMRDDIGRQREAGARKLLCQDGVGQRLTINEYAVAIEDDH